MKNNQLTQELAWFAELLKWICQREPILYSKPSKWCGKVLKTLYGWILMCLEFESWTLKTLVILKAINQEDDVWSSWNSSSKPNMWRVCSPKHVKGSFPHDASFRSDKTLQLVHIDVCDHITPIIFGYESLLLHFHRWLY